MSLLSSLLFTRREMPCNGVIDVVVTVVCVVVDVVVEGLQDNERRSMRKNEKLDRRWRKGATESHIW